MTPEEIDEATIEELYRRIENLERRGRERNPRRRQINHAVESEKDDIRHQMVQRKRQRLEFDKSQDREIEVESPLPEDDVENIDCSVNLQNCR